MFRKANQIAEILITMHQKGCVEFIGERFDCPCGSTDVAELNKKAKMMEQELETWIKKVDNVRDKYYQLNSFTMKQLLYLREELFCNKKLNDRTMFLLKALLPCAPEAAVALAIQTTWLELFDSPNDVADIREWRSQAPSEATITDFEVSDKQQYLSQEDLVESPALTQSERSAYTNMTESKKADPLLTLLVISRGGDKNSCVVQEILEKYEDMMMDEENQPIVSVIQEINRNLSKRSSSWLLKDTEDTSIASDQTESETASTSENDEMSTLSPSSSIDMSLSK